MRRRTWEWHSRELGRKMEVACFGHFGKPLILFPTAGGDFLECERFLMIKALTPLIEAGRIKVYAIGSISREGWMDDEQRPWHKSWLQARYDAYLVNELFPHVANDCGGYSDFATAGASLGAYNAVNAGSKHPEWIDLTVAMSGTYYFDRWMGDHRDENYYYNMPVYFLPNMSQGPHLSALQRSRFILASGSGDYEAPDETRQLAAIMRSKGVGAQLEIWGQDASHDWPTWRTMLPLFLDRAL